jgi:membrane protein YqaA with SNARE-associated domain
MLRRFYEWILQWAKTPYGPLALFAIAFSESSFFFIPPEVLLIALAVSIPQKSFKFAWICSAGSVLGGFFGYYIGWQFMTSIGTQIIGLFGLTEKIGHIESMYNRYDAWAIAIAGFTPIPYKLFTIAAGAFHINVWVFFLASLVSRFARFFLVAGLIYAFGPGIRLFIDKYFNLLTALFVLIFVAGAIIVKLIL